MEEIQESERELFHPSVLGLTGWIDDIGEGRVDSRSRA